MVRPFSTSESVEAEYWRIVNERREKYLNSEEYQRVLKERQEEVARKQEVINHGMLLLPAAIDAGLNAVLNWLENIANATDDSDTVVPATEIVRQLHIAGYRVNEYVLEEGASEQQKFLNRMMLEENPNMFGRYIVGQAMGCLHHMGAIHPSLIQKFVEKFRQKIAA